MTHIWQGPRSGDWRTASRARGYCLILLGICAIAVAGWIAPLSRGVAALTGIPLGLLVLLTLYVFTQRRAALDRVSVAALARGVAQGRSDWFRRKFFCTVAVR